MGCGASAQNKSGASAQNKSASVQYKSTYKSIIVHDGLFGKERTKSWTPLKAPTDDKTWYTHDGEYDKVIVKLDPGKGPFSVEVKKGGCSKAGKAKLGQVLGTKAKTEPHMALLVYERKNKCTEIEVKDGENVIKTMTIPEKEGEWVRDGDFQMKFEKNETKLGYKKDLDALNLSSVTILLDHFTGAPEDATSDDKVVVTFKKGADNKKCVLWLPGRNDSFHNPYAIKEFFEAGYDVYGVEHRRLGRTMIGCDKEEYVLCSHCDDFHKYIEDLDKGFEFALRGKYDKVVLYSHSTGCLESTLYLREGTFKDDINAVVLNSPFFDWGKTGAVVESVLDAADELLAIPSAIDRALQMTGLKDSSIQTKHIQGGKAPTPDVGSNYQTRILLQYECNDYRCRNMVNNAVTLGWARAASKMHDEMDGWFNDKEVDIPALMLSTHGDVVLDAEELENRAKKVFTSKDFEHKQFDDCRHDMLNNFTQEDNEKVMKYILKFLREKLK